MAATSLSQLQVDNNFGDQISQQLDEILVIILSRLPIKEAGRTSVLSGRWRNMWKLTTCLNFDKSGVVECRHSSRSPNELALRRSKFVMWVSEVVRLHECPYLDEFRIHFDLDAKASSHIDEWMKFMVRKRAKKIEIHLTSYSYSPSLECYQYIKSPSNLSNVMCLRSLTFMRVNVDREFAEYLLSKCHHLETLSISYSQNLLSLNVAGPSLPLKYLKIYRCYSLKSIELSAPNLVTFVYSENQVKFIIGNNPLLTELYIGEVSSLPGGLWGVTTGLGLFSSYFSQLETLSLTMAFELDTLAPQVGKLRNLKNLILAIHSTDDVSLLDFTGLIVAAPSLERFRLELSVRMPYAYQIMEPIIQPHECLKQVEICWYSGGWCDFELALYLATNAVNLKKMVLDTRYPPGSRIMSGFDKIVQVANLRCQVKDLKEILHPRAKLIVVY